jgi:plastocyanin
MNFRIRNRFAISRAAVVALFTIALIAVVGGYGIFTLTVDNSDQSTQTDTPVSTSSNSSSSESSSKALVDIVHGAATDRSSRSFSPGTIIVVLGVNNTVVWKNSDTAPHTVTATNGSFGSGNMNSGDIFSWTFSSPGIYHYVCDYHPWMKGTVIVATSN